MNKSITDVCNKYKDKVFVVDFPYSAFEGQHWNNIQRISLHIGVNAFKKKCKFISLIDADEFIYFNRSFNTIESFLENYSCGITMQSNILTNKNDDDIHRRQHDRHIYPWHRFQILQLNYTKHFHYYRILNQSKNTSRRH